MRTFKTEFARLGLLQTRRREVTLKGSKAKGKPKERLTWSNRQYLILFRGIVMREEVYTATFTGPMKFAPGVAEAIERKHGHQGITKDWLNDMISRNNNRVEVRCTDLVDDKGRVLQPLLRITEMAIPQKEVHKLIQNGYYNPTVIIMPNEEGRTIEFNIE